ncbi:MAG: SDR family NAD(P)-dependent oxidoreductase [Bacteroidales bacterium]|jgi:hypothetical protein
MKDFKCKYGPWALVAGASEGLGEAFAREIASRGLNVYLIARREEKLQELSGEIQREYGVQVKYRSVDLSERDQIKDFFSQLDVDTGLVVYNAAYAPVGWFAGLPPEDPEKIVAVNVRGPVLVAHFASAIMKKKGSGGIVLMSSLAGTQGSPKIATYAATKAFNTTFVEGLWKELKPLGIDVLASCAGAILTPGYKNTQHQKSAPGTLTPEQVALKTLNALGKGPVTVPGTMNKLARWLMGRVLPRRWAIELMYQQTKKL